MDHRRAESCFVLDANCALDFDVSYECSSPRSGRCEAESVWLCWNASFCRTRIP